jgi:hypothetical protein
MITKKSLTWLGTLAVLGIMITLFAISNTEPSNAVRILTRPQDAGPSPTPQPPTVPTATPPVAASAPQAQTMDQEIAPCTFAPQTQPSPVTLPLDAFTFSEPQVVLTSTTQMVLLQWISETRSLLLHNHPDLTSPQAMIETFSPQTGKWKRYVEGQLGGASPVWVSREQGIIFTESSPDGSYVLRFSHGIEQAIIDLAVDVPSRGMIVDFTRHQVLFLIKTHEQQLQIASVPYDTPSLTATTFDDVNINLQGRSGMALSPDGMQIAIYGHEGFYLQDRATGQICELDLGQVGPDKRLGFWPQWSDGGKYLALITTYGTREGEMLRMMDLTVVDMTTGQQQQIDFGGRCAYHIYWLPDTRVFLVTVNDANEPNSGFKNLYLVDAVTFDVKNILPDYKFLANRLGVHWTTNDKAIFVSCSQATDMGASYDEWRICKIAAEVRQ